MNQLQKKIQITLEIWKKVAIDKEETPMILISYTKDKELRITTHNDMDTEFIKELLRELVDKIGEGERETVSGIIEIPKR